jgi:hypothetical protein
MHTMLLFLRLRGAVILAAVSGAAAVSAASAAPAEGTGPWRWPLAGAPVVVRGFDPPPVPWAAGHRGVDLRARAGEAVRAAGSGVVGFAGLLAGRGVVAVHHADGLETTYEPLAVLVHAGQRVVIGQLLGRVSPGHGQCGVGFACLHWGLRRGGTYLDPLQLLRSGPIRLLPVWRAPPRTPALDVAADVAADLATAASPGPQQHGRASPGLIAAGAATTAAVASGAALATRRRRRPAPP